MNAKATGFKKFASIRLVVGIILILAILWALGIILGLIDHKPKSTARKDSHLAQTEKSGVHGEKDTGHTQKAGLHETEEKETAHKTAHSSEGDAHVKKSTHAGTQDAHEETATHDSGGDVHAEKEAHGSGDESHQTATHKTAGHEPEETHVEKSSHGEDAEDRHGESMAESHMDEAGHVETSAGVHSAPHVAHVKIRGVAFVEAIVKPMRHELEERFWGWRINDVINLTDNVDNYQLGVLEVTRRATVALAERISRTGTTAAYDKSLEDAMNWFMVKADRYWFPSPESKFKEGLLELELYMEKLKRGEAHFYTRTDNLIPLLTSFEDLLGSCDENLVKEKENDGSDVGFFSADDYFFYTKGVALAMWTILEAVHHDFLLTLESRNGTELLHHAIESCARAVAMDPWIILDRPYDSIFANHRANMAAPISHARFYLGALIKTLST